MPFAFMNVITIATSWHINCHITVAPKVPTAKAAPITTLAISYHGSAHSGCTMHWCLYT